MRDVQEYERERLETRGRPHKLSAEQVLAADAQGMELDEYAAYAGIKSIEDLREYEQSKADRELARRELRVDREKQRLAAQGGAS